MKARICRTVSVAIIAAALGGCDPSVDRVGNLEDRVDELKYQQDYLRHKLRHVQKRMDRVACPACFDEPNQNELGKVIHGE